MDALKTKVVESGTPSAIVNSSPLTDLHRHLEGAIRLSTVLDLCLQHNLPLPAWDISGLQQAVWIDKPAPDILTIFPKFDLLRQVFVDGEAVRRVTRECLEDAEAESLTHVELRFSPFYMAELHRLSPMAVTAQVCETWQDFNRSSGMTSSLTVILSRTYGPEICAQEMACALAYQSQGVAGVDLAGDEMRQPASLFGRLFDQAHAAGLKFTAHAGEFAGSDSIRETIRVLKPQRLGHAVRAVDDPGLMDEIARQGIAVECCPTSNYLTGTIARMEDHPLPVFLRHGICATINTDDPALMGGITIQDEYRHAELEMGLSLEQLEQVRRNGMLAAFR